MDFSYRFLALLMTCVLGSCAGQSVASSRSLACDDGLKAAFRPDANTKVVSVCAITKGTALTAVCPGFIDTEMTGRYTGRTSEGRGRVIAMEPIGRMGKPEEVAAAVVWLCSDAASFVSGHALAVDRGFVVP